MPLPSTLKQKNHIVPIIPATLDAVLSEPYELITDKDYTLISSTLTGAEQITIHIYDYANDTFQPLKSSGDLVKMIMNYELLTFSGVSCVIKVEKTTTASPVGVTIVTR
jgi:hypothetical protein